MWFIENSEYASMVFFYTMDIMGNKNSSGISRLYSNRLFFIWEINILSD